MIELQPGETRELNVALNPIALLQSYIFGSVALQGRPSSDCIGNVISLTMRLIQNGQVVHTAEVSTSTRATFTITVPSGTYDVCIKGATTLSRRLNNVVFVPATPTSVDFGTLLEGDANNDDIINVLDTVLVGQAMGTVPGDPYWNDSCDFNRDGIVDEVDLILLQANFGKVGDCRGQLGDLDDDGAVTEADIDILKKYIFDYPISEISPLSEEEFLRRADVNQDGVIDVGDITAMKIIIYS